LLQRQDRAELALRAKRRNTSIEAPKAGRCHDDTAGRL
jgi:hypothetical protein